ncbi:hypothetical protein OAT67_06400 [Bacteriovoracaceae bacterium]|nr:hypothetical protein [Bacteriovoracaceae bacterium]
MDKKVIIKRNSLSPAQMRKKKLAIRKYKQAQQKKNIDTSIDQDYSKHIEYAILITIGLAVLSVSHPQLGIMAIIFSVLFFAAIIDTKLKIFNKQEKSNIDVNAELIRGLRIIHNEKMQPVISVNRKRNQNISTIPYKK